MLDFEPGPTDFLFVWVNAGAGTGIMGRTIVMDARQSDLGRDHPLPPIDFHLHETRHCPKRKA